MPNETAKISQAAENIAGQIAETAVTIVEENNAETSQAENINRALIESMIEDNRVKHMAAIEDRLIAADSALCSRQDAIDERVSQCLTSQTAMAEQLTNITTVLAMASLIPQSPLLPPNPENADADALENPSPPVEILEAENQPEPPPLAQRKKKRRLV